MDEKQNQDGGIQIEVSHELAAGVYSNLALITHSPTEFVIDFASYMPGIPKAQVCSRIIVAPEHTKRLLMALQDNVAKYERAFGPIQLTQQPQKDRTIAPFSTPKGEA